MTTAYDIDKETSQRFVLYKGVRRESEKYRSARFICVRTRDKKD